MLEIACLLCAGFNVEITFSAAVEREVGANVEI